MDMFCPTLFPDEVRMKAIGVVSTSNIPDEWQGMDEVNFVNRLMAPDAEGTDLSEANDFEVYDVELEFTFDNSWDDTECELVTFIQDNKTIQ